MKIKMSDKLKKGTNIVLTRGKGECVWIYREPQWKKMLERLRTLQITSDEIRALIKTITAGCKKLSIKSKYIELPNYLSEWAEIKEDVVFIDKKSHIEIWAKNKAKINKK